MKGLMVPLLLTLVFPLAINGQETKTKQDSKETEFVMWVDDAGLEALKRHPEGLVADVPVEIRGTVTKVLIKYRPPERKATQPTSSSNKGLDNGRGFTNPKFKELDQTLEKPGLNGPSNANDKVARNPYTDRGNDDSRYSTGRRTGQTTESLSFEERLRRLQEENRIKSDRNDFSPGPDVENEPWPKLNSPRNDSLRNDNSIRTNNSGTINSDPYNAKKTAMTDVELERNWYAREANRLQQQKENLETQRKLAMQDAAAEKLAREEINRELIRLREANRKLYDENIDMRSNNDRFADNNWRNFSTDMPRTSNNRDTRRVGEYGQRLLGYDSTPAPKRERVDNSPRVAANNGIRDLTTMIAGPDNKINNTSTTGTPLGTATHTEKVNGFLLFMLLCSIGLNIYLSWIARSFYVRYAELADELRETFSSTI